MLLRDFGQRAKERTASIRFFADATQGGRVIVQVATVGQLRQDHQVKIHAIQQGLDFFDVGLDGIPGRAELDESYSHVSFVLKSISEVSVP